MKITVSQLGKVEEVSLSDRKDLSLNSPSYHNSELSVNCPRCGKSGELMEDGPVRSLYRCEKCGIFSKLAPKKETLAKAPEKCRLKFPCQGCGRSHGIITEVDRSTGNPHSYRLDCRECGRFQRWIGQREFDRKLGKQGGRDNA
jgi:uncharacterized Zn finger protein